VRNWFVFSASERWREDDSEYEHYTDSGGKSGGQKEKLAYTVLAASLAYRFGLEWGEQRSRSFRFVVTDWLACRPLLALDHAAHWGEALAILDWSTAHPRPGLYLRQLDIPGVDTKFIETHRALLSELLDLVLPESAVDHTAVGARAFNERYGLRSERPLVRFRLLDPTLYLQGLSDLSLPPEQFAALRLPLRRVFITENRTNGLAFPDCPGSMVVFGLGYGPGAARRGRLAPPRRGALPGATSTPTASASSTGCARTFRRRGRS